MSNEGKLYSFPAPPIENNGEPQADKIKQDEAAKKVLNQLYCLGIPATLDLDRQYIRIYVPDLIDE